MKMEFKNLNEAICHKMFGGLLDVTEETVDPFETDKSQVRFYLARTQEAR